MKKQYKINIAFVIIIFIAFMAFEIALDLRPEPIPDVGYYHSFENRYIIQSSNLYYIRDKIKEYEQVDSDSQ